MCREVGRTRSLVGDVFGTPILGEGEVVECRGQR